MINWLVSTALHFKLGLCSLPFAEMRLADFFLFSFSPGVASCRFVNVY